MQSCNALINLIGSPTASCKKSRVSACLCDAAKSQGMKLVAGTKCLRTESSDAVLLCITSYDQREGGGKGSSPREGKQGNKHGAEGEEEQLKEQQAIGVLCCQHCVPAPLLPPEEPCAHTQTHRRPTLIL